ncbi:pilus assembly protein TadG-related protein [Kribbella sp.]|uniref:pilus assembly protein TadG-related protein n=1 Tax=Kribbella sp. TaxID=1871183 RepID=UPI002D659F9B|nr:pilus assembly protein TadG-related protein [Kribbella sp.]HZX04234.1 pilus assembly protein TadG-related protein [Kribbella sp.]
MIRRKRGEDGQMTLLIVGFAVVILLMVVVVTDISKAFLVRRDLDATADGAVLAAANGLAAVYAQPGAGGNAAIDPDQARRLTADYLDEVAAGNRFDNLDWSVDVEGTTVTVRLTSTTQLPFRPPGFPTSAGVSSESAAIVPIR